MHRPITVVMAAICLCLTSAVLAGPRFVWEPGAKMPIGKGGQVTGLVNGKLLAAGGTYWINGEKKFWTGDLYVYDPATDKWSEAPAVPFPLSYGSGRAINNKLYVVSGTDGEKDYTYTLICVWRGGQYHWIWGPPVPEPRIYSVAVAIGSKLYVINGSPDSAFKGKVHDDILILDTKHPEKGWTRSRPMPGTGRTLVGAAAIDDKIYIFGGYRQIGDELANSDDAFVYDTKADRWSRLPDCPYAARCWDAMAIDGQIYIMGGYVTWPAAMMREESFTDHIMRFDPETGTYWDAGEIPIPNTQVNPRVLPDGRIMISGGEDKMKHRTDLVGFGKLVD